MADIDYDRSFVNGFTIVFSDNPGKITGNRLLLNIFEITFMTERRRFLMGDDSVIADNYGGEAQIKLGVPRVLADHQAISAAINIITNQTVKDMRADEKVDTPATEKIDKAEVLSVDSISGVITATIRVYPVETQSYENLVFNLPIVRE